MRSGLPAYMNTTEYTAERYGYGLQVCLTHEADASRMLLYDSGLLVLTW
jgi:hypothetical protein